MRLGVDRTIEQNSDQELQSPGLDTLTVRFVKGLDDTRPV